MELTEGWRAAIADDELRRRYPEVDFDDGAWQPIAARSQWRSTPAFADTDGPLLYRVNFEATDEGARSWLVCDGIFYTSDVWLDGNYLGDTEGYFVPHVFEITEALRASHEHTLALEVACARPDDLNQKRNITGVFQHWDCLDPDDSPGGIWQPVRLAHTGPVRITTLRVLCPRADAQRASLELAADLDTTEALTINVRTVVTHGGRTVDHEAEHAIAAESNSITWRVDIDDPALWWPHALGDANLAQVEVSVFVVADDGTHDLVASDTRQVTTGLRSVSMRDFRWTVNGERLFVKGVNLGPTRAHLADASPEEVARDVELAKQTNLDLVRVHAHVARPELYDAADRAGVLVWQDMPLQWGYARGVRKQAARQARAMVDVLGHHPSIALWCGHNEPFTPSVRGYVVGQQLPTWNKTILDNTVKRALERADKTRPVIAHSGVLPHVGNTGTDTHVYFGWYHGEERDFPEWLRRVPRLAQFVSEFGSQAIPDSDEFMEAERWPDLDWTRLAHTHCLQLEPFERHVPPANYANYDDWRAATQRYQATILKHHVETLRRLKYRPTGGFAAFFWADAHPAVTWSVLDHERKPKLGFYALAAACAPVIVVAERPAPVYEPGEPIVLDVHVISDRRDTVAS
ncbi:MAG TPA: glycoside hydrolase family 2 TIM barrel-domain containing protein, partial [Acidimicrobiales bacterium]|nr:glycoside hydrolase family 2 TIM barrel-domain containing protein [Acidimicrobiales bacterium]